MGAAIFDNVCSGHHVSIERASVPFYYRAHATDQHGRQSQVRFTLSQYSLFCTIDLILFPLTAHSAGETLAYLWEAAVEEGGEGFGSAECEEIGKGVMPFLYPV